MREMIAHRTAQVALCQARRIRLPGARARRAPARAGPRAAARAPGARADRLGTGGSRSRAHAYHRGLAGAFAGVAPGRGAGVPTPRARGAPPIDGGATLRLRLPDHRRYRDDGVVDDEELSLRGLRARARGSAHQNRRGDPCRRLGRTLRRRDAALRRDRNFEPRRQRSGRWHRIHLTVRIRAARIRARGVAHTARLVTTPTPSAARDRPCNWPL